MKIRCEGTDKLHRCSVGHLVAVIFVRVVCYSQYENEFWLVRPLIQTHRRALFLFPQVEIH